MVAAVGYNITPNLETPKLFRKKSKVKTWFNGVAREVFTGEDLPVRVSSVTTGNTVATFQGYPSLPVTILNRKQRCRDPLTKDWMAWQQFILLQAQLAEGNGEIKQKDKDKSFAQTWQESATPETQDPIGRVVTMLE